MENLNIDLNLLRFENAFVMDIQGRQVTKRCVCIPIEDNDIFVSKDEMTQKAKGAYVQLTAWESREERFGQTHYIKQSFSKEYKEAHLEEVKNRPILGNGKPVQIVNNNAAQSVQVANMPFNPSNDNDLPF